MRNPVHAAIFGLAALALPVSVLAGPPTTYQTSNAISFATGAPVAGAAALYRTAQSVRTTLSTSGLPGSSAYTLWFVIFNNPTACAAGCGEPDLGNPAVRASVLYAAGFLTSSDGTANVAAQLDAGTPPKGVDVLFGKALEPGNGFGAEVHLVVRNHGAPIPGQVAKQISTFDPLCNTCTDLQAVVFAPFK